MKGFIDCHQSHRLIDKKYGNGNKWQGKKLCRICTVELIGAASARSVKTCSNCGEKYELFHSCKGPSSKFLIAKSCLKCACHEQLTVSGVVNNLIVNTPVFEEIHNCRRFNLALKGDYSKAEKCSSYIIQTDYEKKCLNGEMEQGKANIQIILDFSSLKDIMSKGGLIMTTYKCPNCNGMVNIPEAGKILVCQYCQTPIKPVDIFEKIKTLIQ